MAVPMYSVARFALIKNDAVESTMVASILLKSMKRTASNMDQTWV